MASTSGHVPPRVLLPNSPWCQRWRRQLDSWRHTSEGGFDPARYCVTRIGYTDAKTFVVEHHYTASMPATRWSWGLFDNTGLVGVAVLSVPVSNRVTEVVLPDLTPIDEALELGRFVLLDPVPANAETWFLARVLRDAATEGVKGVVSFADPVPRHLNGTLIRRGHVGTVYQASANVVYTGRTTPRSVRIYRAGRVNGSGGAGRIVNGKSLQKFRDGRNGNYLYDELLAYGARPIVPGEHRHVWLQEALDAVTVVRRHAGQHRFVFPLGRTRRERSRVRIAVAGQPYPKTVDEPWTM